MLLSDRQYFSRTELEMAIHYRGSIETHSHIGCQMELMNMTRTKRLDSTNMSRCHLFRCSASVSGVVLSRASAIILSMPFSLRAFCEEISVSYEPRMFVPGKHHQAGQRLTVKHVLYFVNRSLHSSVEEFPRRYSDQSVTCLYSLM